MTHPCYIFDIDGTVADCSHRLHHIQKTPKDWPAFFAACANDKPINHICDLMRDLACIGHQTIFLTGRSDECADQTRAWLDANDLPYARLYMRAAGDHRDDVIVKIELLSQLRDDGYEPIMVFEDRARVVKAWREAGIPCAQVAEGDF